MPSVRLVVPVEGDTLTEGEALQVRPLGRRGPWEYLAVIDMDESGILRTLTFLRVSLDDPSDAAEVLLDLEPDALIGRGIPLGLLTALLENGVPVFGGDFSSLNDVVEAYLSGRLRPVIPGTEGDVSRPLN